MVGLSLYNSELELKGSDPFSTLSMILLLLLVQGCVSTSQTHQVAGEPALKTALYNPETNDNERLSKYDFFYEDYTRWHSPSISKAVFKRAIKLRDSGYAHDAFVASFAYNSGYFKGKEVRSPKGRNRNKSLLYLKKAAELGLPEANFILYNCYAPFGSYDDQDGYRKRLKFDCYRHNDTDDDYWDFNRYKRSLPSNSLESIIKPDAKLARKYLERTAELGYKFDLKFNPIVGETQDENKRLSHVINLIITKYKSNSIRRHADTMEKKQGTKVLDTLSNYERDLTYTDDFKSCDLVYKNMMIKAKDDERMLCPSSNGQSCPGKGYLSVRKFLEACQYLSPNNIEWEYYFNERLKLQHVYFDGRYNGFKHRFLKGAITHYESLGDKDNVAYIRQLIAKSRAADNKNSKKWNTTWKRNRAAYNAKKAREKNEKEKRRALSLAKHKKYKEQKARNAERSKRRRAAAWGDVVKNFGAPDELGRMHNQAMKKLDTIRISKQRSPYSSSAAKKQKKNKATKESVQATRAQQSRSQVSANTNVRKKIKTKDEVLNTNTRNNNNKHSSESASIKKKNTTAEKKVVDYITLFAQEESTFSWPTQKSACTYGKAKALNAAKKECSEKGGVQSKQRKNDINCQSYRQMDKDGFSSTKGQWKATGNVIFYCKRL